MENILVSLVARCARRCWYAAWHGAVAYQQQKWFVVFPSQQSLRAQARSLAALCVVQQVT